MKGHSLPRISVITPSYGQGQFIEETIQSVLRQRYPNLEYWVIDGGSKDNTLQVLKKYTGKIQWISEKDKGQTDAINKGLSKITGEIICYLNSDDVMAPGTLNTVAKEWQKREFAWLTGDAIIIDAQGQSREQYVRWYKNIQRSILEYFPFLFEVVISINNPIIQPSTFWSRKALQKIGLLNVELRYTMDYDYWWRLYKYYGSPRFSHRVFSFFRVHKSSKGSTDYARQMNEQLTVAQKHGALGILLFLQRCHSKAITIVYRYTKT